MVLVDVVDDEVLFHDVVHHLHLALAVPHLLLDANQEGLWRLKSLDHVQRQVGDQRVVPLEGLQQSYQRLHQHSHIGHVLLDQNDFLLEQESAQQLQDLVDRWDFREQQMEIEVLDFELGRILVNIAETEIRELVGRVPGELETDGWKHRIDEVQVVEGHSAQELRASRQHLHFERLSWRQVNP